MDPPLWLAQPGGRGGVCAEDILSLPRVLGKLVEFLRWRLDVVVPARLRSEEYIEAKKIARLE
jgi:hypothetical protein